jgi:hypothetical protein
VAGDKWLKEAAGPVLKAVVLMSAAFNSDPTVSDAARTPHQASSRQRRIDANSVRTGAVTIGVRGWRGDVAVVVSVTG